MAYFSPKSTWLSLVEPEGTSSNGRNPDGLPMAFEDYSPSIPSLEGSDPSPGDSRSRKDLESLQTTRELRHRLFFHFKEWEFGPGLLEDTLKLAQAQTVPEEALAWYCHARMVAKTLVERWGQVGFLLPWLETDRVIAEIHQLIGQKESCAVYAREGLETIKKNRFDASMDLKITRLAIRFFKLLGTW